MDDFQIKKIIQEQWGILPENIQKLILSSEFDSKIEQISRKYNLLGNQTVNLKNEIVFVLLGLVHLMDFTQNLEHELAIPKEQARLLAQEVGAQIFANVKESLRELGKTLELENAQDSQNSLGTDQQKPTNQNVPPPIATVQGVHMQKESLTPETQDSIIVASANVEKEEGNVQTGIVEDVASLNKETLLKEIESPALITAHASTPEYEPTIIDKKLSGIMKVPREEVRVNVDANTPSYKGTDPYREPLE